MPLNFRIFKKKPQPGKPLAIDGMASALNFMARAWETLDVWRGRVDWNDGRPLIIVDGLDEVSGSPQLDHAFLPTQTAATTATLTPGNFYDREGVRRDISLPGQNWNDGNIDFATNRYWYAQIRYWDDQSENEGVFRDLRWFSDTTAFPVFRLSAFTENIPIIEFPDGTWASMIRRQTNDWFAGVKGATGEQGIQGIQGPPGDDADCGGLYGPDNPPPYDGIDGAPDPDAPWDTPPPSVDIMHAGLGDIVDGSAGDDHSGTNYNYLANVGDSGRNKMTGTIGDAIGGLSISAPARTLTDAAGETAAGWEARKLYDNSGVESADWHFGWLRVSATETSINWKDRVLQSSGLATIEWEHGRINGDNGGVSIQWFDRTLVDADGAVVLNWLLRQLAGGDWDVTAGHLDVSLSGKVYKHLGVAGVTGSGFSGGIKTGEGSEEAYQESAVDVTLTAASSFANMTATATATLPASVAGRRFTIAATAAGGATVAAHPGELINGQATQTLSQYDAMTVIGTGTGWIII